MLTSRLGGLVTAVAELNNGSLVMIMDVEKCWRNSRFCDNESVYEGIEPHSNSETTVFCG